MWGAGHRGEGWHEGGTEPVTGTPQTWRSLVIATRNRYTLKVQPTPGVAVRKRGIKADSEGRVEPFTEMVTSRFGGKNPDRGTLGSMCLRNTRGDID